MNHQRHHRTRLLGRTRDNLRVGTLMLWCALLTMFRVNINLQPERSVGRNSDRPTRRPAAATLCRGFGRALGLFVLGLLLATSATVEAAEPGEPIPNFATLDYSVDGVGRIQDSNIVTVIVRSPATIRFMKYVPSSPGAEDLPVGVTAYDPGTGIFTDIPQPGPSLQPTVPLLETPSYYLGETFYLWLEDKDQNVDPTVRETIILTVSCAETGDTETLRLFESDVDSGVFTGYLPSTTGIAPAADGQMVITEDCHLEASYTDSFDLIKTVTTAALVDPYGFVFDSMTGELLDGATVTLIDVATGQPALVYGDDGVSIYQPDASSPSGSNATVITGGNATDESGKTYNLPTGGFRFPYVLPGTYLLEITPPDGYSAPTLATNSQLLTVRPDAVIVIGSRGEEFTVNPGPALRIDIPVDPAATDLWLQKEVNNDQATIGDFLQYRLTLENISSTSTARDIEIDDRLPLGFRYQDGSARLNGAATKPPRISADGRTLTFTVGDLAPEQSLEVTYVVEVAAGTQNGDAINRAQAEDDLGTRSNIARSTVEITDVFFRNTTFLLGRVMTGSCEQKDTEMPGLSGVRVYLEDGSYVVTDAEGKYHFEGVEPGVHVVQVDLDTVPVGYELVPCEQTSQTAGRSFSQFVDLQGGTLWKVDFYATPLPAPNGEISLQLFSELEGTVATLRAVVTANSVPADNLRLTIMLPGKATYIEGSTRLNGTPQNDPFAVGGAVTLRAPHLGPGGTMEFVLKADLEESDAGSELPAKALLTFDSPTARNQRTPIATNRFMASGAESSAGEEIRLHPHFPSFVAELQETDLAMLAQLVEQLRSEKIARIDIVGHTDNQRIAPRSRHIHADNQALSEARAHSVSNYLQQHLQVPAGVLSQRGLGESMPVADNRTETGRALNRRVELYVVTETVEVPGQLDIVEAASEVVSRETTGTSPAKAGRLPSAKSPPKVPKAPKITNTWLAKTPRETYLVWPPTGYTPVNPTTEFIIQYPRGSHVALRLNGTQVPDLNLDTSLSVPNSGFDVSLWYGVDLERGENLFEAIITKDGQQTIIERTLWYVYEIGAIKFIESESVLVADGITQPAIAVKVMDEDGIPVRPGMEIEYRVSAPYQPDNTTATRTNLPAGTGIMTTGAGGIAYANLLPTTQSGDVTISLMADQDHTVSTWLKPVARDWILVGFAEGTLGYNTFSGNQVSLEEAGIDEHSYNDGRVKFFAKGAIKGEWLLTMAYDSDKPDLDGDSLHQIIDPDTYYPLYGDGTRQGYEAASARDIYIKLERDQFYALFGDMSTDLDQTELARYTRSMNGFKSEMETDKFRYTVFASDTKQAFAKDEIRGDGTSGRYSLSNKDLVINSETVTIETRGRLHSEVIIDSVTLNRHTDYDIDYDNGTLFFKRPIPSKDEDFNPVFIIVRYETRDSENENFTYGGRAAVKLLDNKVEIGATYVHEEKGAGEGDLYGVDATVQLTPHTTVHVEAATTDTEHYDEKIDADAYLVEVEHTTDKLAARAYFREQEGGFGLGQQNGSEDGTRKYGAEGSAKVTSQVAVSGEIYHEDNLGTGAERDVAEVTGSYQGKRIGIYSGVREAKDRFEDSDTQRSTQWLIGGDWVSPDRKVKLRADYEQSLRSENENSDFPTLLTLGADYQLTERVSLFAEQEFTWGENEDTEGTRAGIQANPWQGGDVRTTVEREFNENGQRVFALFGLAQTWKVTERWSVDLQLDRSYTLKHPGNDRFNTNVPAAHGDDEDFTAISAGATYRADSWAWSGRLENRHSDTEDKYGVSTSVVSEPRAGIALSAKLFAFLTDASDGARRTDGDIRLGLAYRPIDSRLILLDRFDVYFEREENTPDGYNNWRMVNHLHANFKANRTWQISYYYGMKYVRDNISGQSYNGFTDMHAFETRYNINARWDFGLYASVLHSWDSNRYEYAAGVDVGYSPMTNAWISLGYNFVGFEDEDFDAAHYTRQGPYMRFRMKFDQKSVRDAAEWINDGQ